MLVKTSNSGKVVITEEQQRILRELAASRTCPKFLSQRSRIILMAFERYKNDEIGAAVGLERHAVGPWRRRWVRAFDRLIHAECGGKPGELRREIETVLRDAPRGGCKGKFTTEQKKLIIALACEPPENSGRPHQSLDASRIGCNPPSA